MARLIGVAPLKSNVANEDDDSDDVIVSGSGCSDADRDDGEGDAEGSAGAEREEGFVIKFDAADDDSEERHGSLGLALDANIFSAQINDGMDDDLVISGCTADDDNEFKLASFSSVDAAI